MEAQGTGPPNLAKLAREEKYFAIRHRMRAGKVAESSLKGTYQGATAVEWLWKAVCNWNFAMRLDEDSLVPFKILAEMKHRYVSKLIIL
jgi:hypothetical protein